MRGKEEIGEAKSEVFPVVEDVREEAPTPGQSSVQLRRVTFHDVYLGPLLWLKSVSYLCRGRRTTRIPDYHTASSANFRLNASSHIYQTRNAQAG